MPCISARSFTDSSSEAAASLTPCGSPIIETCQIGQQDRNAIRATHQPHSYLALTLSWIEWVACSTNGAGLRVF